jgi:hypothetical protein
MLTNSQGNKDGSEFIPCDRTKIIWAYQSSLRDHTTVQMTDWRSNDVECEQRLRTADRQFEPGLGHEFSSTFFCFVPCGLVAADASIRAEGGCNACPPPPKLEYRISKTLIIYTPIHISTGAGTAQSVQCLTGRSGFYPRQIQRIFSLTSASRPALGPTQPPVQWVPGALSPGVKRGQGVMLTTHALLVPRLRKSRSYTSCHPNAPLWSVTGPLLSYKHTADIYETNRKTCRQGRLF